MRWVNPLGWYVIACRRRLQSAGYDVPDHRFVARRNVRDGGLPWIIFALGARLVGARSKLGVWEVRIF